MPLKKTSAFEKFFNGPLDVKDDSQVKEIGNYRPTKENYVETLLKDNTKATNELYKGFDEYQNGNPAKKIKSHQEKIADFIKKHPHMFPTDVEKKAALNNPNFFMEQFVLFNQKIIESPEGTLSSPKIVTMNEFYGKSGTELYQLALEEEMNSKAFMDRVFNASITEYDGPKWKKPVIAFIGGPSASGKTTATKTAFESIAARIEKDETNLEKNRVTKADGADGRDESFIYTLAKMTSERKNCKGISDLDSKSKVLGEVKVRSLETAFATQDLSITIPETFSDPKKIAWFIHTIMRSDRQPEFSRITIDRDTVKKMGTDRAYTNDPKTTEKLRIEVNKGMYPLQNELTQYIKTLEAVLKDRESTITKEEKDKLTKKIADCEKLKSLVTLPDTHDFEVLQNLKIKIEEFSNLYSEEELTESLGSLMKQMQTSIDTLTLLKINDKTQHESKKYNEYGYYLGDIGSQIVESVFNIIADSKSTVLDKDLFLLQEDSKNPGHWKKVNHSWLTATSHKDKDALVISKTVYEDWLALKKEAENNGKTDVIGLIEYKAQQGMQAPKILESTDKPYIDALALPLLQHGLFSVNKKIRSLSKQLSDLKKISAPNPDEQSELLEELKNYLQAKHGIEQAIQGLKEKQIKHVKEIAPNLAKAYETFSSFFKHKHNTSNTNPELDFDDNPLSELEFETEHPLHLHKSVPEIKAELEQMKHPQQFADRLLKKQTHEVRQLIALKKQEENSDLDNVGQLLDLKVKYIEYSKLTSSEMEDKLNTDETIITPFENNKPMQEVIRKYLEIEHTDFYKNKATTPKPLSDNSVQLRYKNTGDQFQFMFELAKNKTPTTIRDPKTQEAIAKITQEGLLQNSDGIEIKSAAEYDECRKRAANKPLAKKEEEISSQAPVNNQTL